MKNLFALVALVFAVNQASATSLLSNVLQYENNAKHSGNTSQALSVYIDGQVVHRTLSNSLPGGMKAEKMMTLTGKQIEKIQQLVQAATPAKLGFEVSRAMCITTSMFTQKYTASNTSLFLREGAVCDGGFKVNTKPAAKKLVAVLSTLVRAHHNKTNLAEVEAQIDRILQ